MPKKIITIISLLLSFLLTGLAQENPVRLSKPISTGEISSSGDKQQQKAGTELKLPVRVQVIDALGNPVAGAAVRFEELSSPEGGEGFKIKNRIAFTDSSGIATTPVRLGKKAGEYTLMARLRNFPEGDFLVYRFTAQRNNWVFMMIIGLLGGLVLFLLGMNMMSEGMQKSAGSGLRSILGNLTRNRFTALGMGTVMTMVIQSSSATTVMMVSFVNSGLMVFRQTLGVILGAAIGTTITAQLIAFRLTDYALLMIAIGFALHGFAKKEKIVHAGEALMGFGILFFGMEIMSEAMTPLRTFTPFINFILHLENPLTGIIIGALFTALIQSSSAFIGIMIVLASQGLLNLQAGIPLLLGANIGTAITAILASLKASDDAKKVALAHTLFKVFGVLLVVWWIPRLVNLVEWISPSATGVDSMNVAASELPRQIANAHTIFNVLVTLIILPFLNTAANLIESHFSGERKNSGKGIWNKIHQWQSESATQPGSQPDKGRGDSYGSYCTGYGQQLYLSLSYSGKTRNRVDEQERTGSGFPQGQDK